MFTMPNCVVCVLRPMVTIGSLCGCSPFASFCPHCKNFSPRPCFRPSDVRTWASVAFVLFIAASTAFNASKVGSAADLTELLESVTEALLCAGSLNYCFFGLVHASSKKSELNGLAAIVEQRLEFGVAEMLDSKMTEALVRKYVAFVATWAFGQTSLSVYLHFNRFHSVWSMMGNSVTLLLNSYVHFTVFYQVWLGTSLYKAFFRNCCENLRVQLETTKSKVEVLNNCRRLYRSLTLTYNHQNVYFSPSLLLWWLEIIVLLIVNFYLITLTSGRFGKSEYLLFVRSYGGIMCVVAFLIYKDEIDHVSEDILSFLFKYPISKLSRAEAAQVEMLISSLKRQRPTLRASDIFTISVRLLASISGTVITYVLVALQFHASWNKEDPAS